MHEIHGEGITAMINAAIVSTDLPWDGLNTRNCHDFVLRRDYRLVALLRTFNQLDEAVAELGVDVVVFPTRVVDGAAILDNDTTKVLRRRRNVAIGRHRVPAPAPLTEYETAPILPRGNDGGFAETFLKDRRPDS